MNLVAGEILTIVNLTWTPHEEARFHLHDVFDYRDQVVCYATKLSHEVRAFRGIISVKTRKSSWVILPRESPYRTIRLIEILKGSPLAIRDGRDLLYIVNTDSGSKIWNGPLKNRDDHLEKCRRVIDEYYKLRDAGDLDAPPGTDVPRELWLPPSFSRN